MSREKLLNETLDLINEFNVTAYEIEKNTTLSAVGVQKIIDGKSKRPFETTLSTIKSYITNAYVNKSEPEEKSISQKFIEEEEAKAKKPNLIPLYKDVVTYGSNINSELSAVSQATEYIDAGSWFGDTKITAGIRHYGDSMQEYPNGCILVIREINDLENVVYGRNYVIETNEIRVTKRIQSSENEKYFTAYSTNTETYPDGRQIHEPFKINKSKIKRILLVIGRIVKEHSSGPAQIV
ncbi:Uncharacterised protein [Candidatus Ornithobacterium hominis]|uniref:S24 family peptidase n=1 Tax=Candidatus Ornithobacterium hominis TaxID=2497989 RepID=UPI000E5C4FF9|nr:S24 family peptidase [Candidatus Ornithobacterium hominis]SZD72038.1 Uncharacterised protein [Candidatus Ornithobacterium hominis]